MRSLAVSLRSGNIYAVLLRNSALISFQACDPALLLCQPVCKGISVDILELHFAVQKGIRTDAAQLQSLECGCGKIKILSVGAVCKIRGSVSCAGLLDKA